MNNTLEDHILKITNYIADIFNYFDYNDMYEWEDSIYEYIDEYNILSGPISLSQGDYKNKIDSLFNYIKFLKEVNLLDKLCNFYFYKAIDKDSWMKRLTVDIGLPIAPMLEPYETSKCNKIIRLYIIDAISRKELKIYPAGKLDKKGNLVFFESEYLTNHYYKNNKEFLSFFNKESSIIVNKELPIVYPTTVPLYKTNNLLSNNTSNNEKNISNPSRLIVKIYDKIKSKIRSIKNV